jgi:HK97 gp10 family phage protein
VTAVARKIRETLAQGRTYLDIEGLAEVQDLLDTLRNTVPEKCEQVLIKYGELMASAARSGIKSKTGNLKGSIKTKRTFTANTKKVSVNAGGKKAPHAHLVEYGHRMVSHSGEVIGDVEGTRFLGNAFEKHRDAMIDEMNAIIWSVGD